MSVTVWLQSVWRHFKSVYIPHSKDMDDISVPFCGNKFLTTLTPLGGPQLFSHFWVIFENRKLEVFGPQLAKQALIRKILYYTHMKANRYARIRWERLLGLVLQVIRRQNVQLAAVICRYALSLTLPLHKDHSDEISIVINWLLAKFEKISNFPRIF